MSIEQNEKIAESKEEKGPCQNKIRDQNVTSSRTAEYFLPLGVVMWCQKVKPYQTALVVELNTGRIPNPLSLLLERAKNGHEDEVQLFRNVTNNCCMCLESKNGGLFTREHFLFHRHIWG